MTRVPFVDLAAQYREIAPRLRPAMSAVLTQTDFILGAQLQEFERAFAAYVRSEYAVGVGSGLDALRLSLMALDIGPGDEVIVPANTFIATALAVSAVGAKPVLVDCDPDDYNINPALIESAIAGHTRAVIPVHLAGCPAPMSPILDVAGRRRLHVVEDAAQAHGALYDGKHCGSLGILGCFSFYPGKNLGAYGDGGAVVTHDTGLAARLRRLRNYGQEAKYDHVEKGLNARLDTLQAAVLNVKLKFLTRWNAARRKHAQAYLRQLDGVGDLRFQRQDPRNTPIYHLFILETERRDDLQKYLHAAGIQTGIHYPRPIHLQRAYQDLGYREGDFPNAERLARRMLSLPMFPELTPGQISFVASRIKKFFSGR